MIIFVEISLFMSIVGNKIVFIVYILFFELYSLQFSGFIYVSFMFWFVVSSYNLLFSINTKLPSDFYIKIDFSFQECKDNKLSS